MLLLITTPTRAYEAYNKISDIKQYQLVTKKQELYNIPPIAKLSANHQTQLQNSSQDLCAVATAKAEKQYQIKPQLLQTIASVESGRWDEKLGRRIAWPWTIQADGKGYYYKSKQEAVAAIKALYAQGITNIDVGCMQINMRYHRKAFKSIEDSLDPEQNVAYSAKFLRSLYNRNGHNWQKTAMQYHSINYERGLIYKGRLEKHYAEYINSTANQSLF